MVRQGRLHVVTKGGAASLLWFVCSTRLVACSDCNLVNTLNGPFPTWLPRTALAAALPVRLQQQQQYGISVYDKACQRPHTYYVMSMALLEQSLRNGQHNSLTR
jgi:hypothetical protein